MTAAAIEAIPEGTATVATPGGAWTVNNAYMIAEGAATTAISR